MDDERLIAQIINDSKDMFPQDMDVPDEWIQHQLPYYRLEAAWVEFKAAILEPFDRFAAWIIRRLNL